MNETDLYPSIKNFLEKQGYEVKSEIYHCDVLAIRENDKPVIVELKLSLNLTVVLQALDRLKYSDLVYIGIPSTCSAYKKQRKQLSKLLKMLGLGLLVVNMRLKNHPVKALFQPSKFQPRISKYRQQWLLNEFKQRQGDPNSGGASTKGGIVTAYRQQAVKIAEYLLQHGSCKASTIAKTLEIPNARDILYKNYYGWFVREDRGIYGLSGKEFEESLQLKANMKV